MFRGCLCILECLGIAVAQDLFEQETKFLAQHGSAIQTVNPNGTSLSAHLEIVSGESWWKTITPSENHMLCLDAPGGNAFNGNMLWLWECNGMDSQIWVFDHYQIRYGLDEKFCIDAREMQNGEQLMLWECNGDDQQTWGYDFDALRVYISNTAVRLDASEGDTSSGQPLHVWECNALSNQQWNLWDSGGPHFQQNVFPLDHCKYATGLYATGLWPSFKTQSDLQNDAYWSAYFNSALFDSAIMYAHASSVIYVSFASLFDHAFLIVCACVVCVLQT